VLLQLQQEAEAEAKRAVEARKISIAVNDLLVDMLNMAKFSRRIDPTDWEKSGYKGYLNPQYHVLLNNVQKQYDYLYKLTANKPVLYATVKKVHKPFAEAMAMFEEANKQILAGNIDQVVATSAEKSVRLSALTNEFVSQELLVVAKNEEDFANSSNQKQAEIRQTTVKFTFAVVLANVVLSLFIARFLVQTITSRLKIMSDNAVRLAAHQPLHSPLEGQDEIAELDHTFHKMAETIEESAQVKQELYNMLTHDMRTPLTAIQGSLEMLAMDKSAEFSERSKKLIRVAVRNSTRTMGLVNDLLDSQKLEANMLTIDPEEVHLEDVFEIVSMDISGWVEEKGIKLIFDPTTLVVMADQEKLSRILFNLISNAIKYSPPQGMIEIKAVPSSKMAEITVKDQGPGIPKHRIKTVFERFKQGDSDDPVARLGSGLGLSICHDFVDMHGGKIWATSEVGHGSVFHFTIPLA